MASADGYYRYPTLCKDQLAFVCEDDIWVVALSGGIPRRLSAAPGPVTHARFSPTGQHLAFTCCLESYQEVYVMDGEGGPCTRLTYLGADTATVLAWSPDATLILFSSSANQAMPGTQTIWMVGLDGGAPTPLTVGPCTSFAFQPGGRGRLLGRHTGDLATTHWKGYRGGCLAQLWLDPHGDNAFERVPGLTGDSVGNPAWVQGDRLVFVSDHDPETAAGDRAACGAVYSCNIRNGGERRLLATAPAGFYARHLTVDSSCPSEDLVVFMAGGQLYVAEHGQGGLAAKIPIRWRGPKAGLEQRCVCLGKEALGTSRLEIEHAVDSISVHPTGLSLSITSNGQAFSMGLFDGPALVFTPYGATPTYAPRCRLLRYLYDWPRLIMVADGSGEDDLEIHTEDGSVPPRRLGLDPHLLGRPVELIPSPQGPVVAVVNSRGELLLVDTISGEARVADLSAEEDGITGAAWSPCGRWLAYSYSVRPNVACLKLCDVESGTTTRITRPEFWDEHPAWDPAGKHLYFLSSREFEPVYDELQHGLSFPRGQRPYVITLRAHLPNPLLPELRPIGEDEGEDEGGDEDEEGSYDSEDDGQESPTPIEIDLEGIQDRVLVLPVANGRYAQLPKDRTRDQEISEPGVHPSKNPCWDVVGLEDDCLMYTVFPVPNQRVGFVSHPESVASQEDDDEDPPGDLVKFDLRRLKETVLVASAVHEVVLSLDGRTTAILEADTDGNPYVRMVPSGEKPKEEDDDREEIDPYAAGRASGVVDLDARLRVLASPLPQWGQMLRHTWRAARDAAFPLFLSNPKVGPWEAVYERHAASVLTCATRTELQDVLTELVSDLRCSHAYACMPSEPHHRGEVLRPAALGADLVWDASQEAYRITNLVKGDIWCAARGGPLAKPGLGVDVGDLVLAINRQRLTAKLSPHHLLLEAADQEVMLTVRSKDATGDLQELFSKITLKVEAQRTPQKPTKGGGGEKGKGGKGKGNKGSVQAQAKSMVSSKPGGVGTGGAVHAAQLQWARDGFLAGDGVRHLRVRTLVSDVDARYRDMVGARRAEVWRQGGGRVGYLHVPDMERLGFSEFQRHWAQERSRGALLVDLRGNAGGHISELLLPRLALRTNAHEIPRRGSSVPFPEAAVEGPVVLLIDESSCSDAEICAHAFRQMRLGPIVGMRSWGGVAGVSEDEMLVDGTHLGVPVMGIFMNDVGFALENTGVAPDIEVAISPQDYATGKDPQLERAVLEATRLLDQEAAVVKPPPVPKLPQDNAGAAAASLTSGRTKWPFKFWQPIKPAVERMQDVPWAELADASSDEEEPRPKERHVYVR